ncbi:hypothetical protein AMECASPLE_005925 [Ameca splendens]|uniref:Uncharacterized protein n=1 Tax=Ameca splendens TaxID=208324 RepID=A0ABV0Z8X3_9TELE
MMRCIVRKLMPLQSSFQTIHQGELSHLHLSSALLCHCSPLVPSFLIVTMKQLADVTFNYGCISSGVVEAEPSQCCSEKKKNEELHYNLLRSDLFVQQTGEEEDGARKG